MQHIQPVGLVFRIERSRHRIDRCFLGTPAYALKEHRHPQDDIKRIYILDKGCAESQDDADDEAHSRTPQHVSYSQQIEIRAGEKQCQGVAEKRRSNRPAEQGRRLRQSISGEKVDPHGLEQCAAQGETHGCGKQRQHADPEQA